MFALTPAHNRRKDLDACAFRQFHHGIYHLIDRLFLDGTSTLRTMWNSYAGIQQSKIIINFRHGSDGGTRVPVRRFLIDRNSRRQAFDAVHIRFSICPKNWRA